MSRIRSALDSLRPTLIRLQDDSHKHAGHAGARDGRGHFSLFIVSRRFEGLSQLMRHRAIYAVLSDLLESDIHALAIQAKTPDEASRGKSEG